MNFILDKAFYIDAAVTAGYLVKFASHEHVTPVTGTNDAAIGVAQESADASDVTNGKVINVRILGIARCVAQADIAPGAKVRAHSSGKVAALAGTAGLVENIVGIMISDPAADGDHCDVLLTPGVITNTAAS